VDSNTAIKIIESLRHGIPAENFVEDFTVGRGDEIDELKNILLNHSEKALLLKSNYGSGKTHLLKLIREIALSNGYAVSLITLDSGSAVRFNRMDQIFGQICRQLEVPSTDGKSVRHLFNMVSSVCNSKKVTDEILNLTDQGKWKYSNYLKSPALYVALRAWFFADNMTKDLIEDWLFNSWEYKTQRKKLYNSFVGGMRRCFNDPRPDWQFYNYKLFDFSDQGYLQSWNALNDLNTLVKIAGFKGLVLLFDEFEDIVYNLKNIKYQQIAFWNLFQFFGGAYDNAYDNFSAFAVTPGFAEKCKEVLLKKEIHNYDYSSFDKLKTFEMSPLSESQMFDLSKKIVSVHSTAYNWVVPNGIVETKLRDVCKSGMKIAVEDRVRQTIKDIVNVLDEILETNDG